MQDTQNQQGSASHNDETFTCAKCGKTKKRSEGDFVLEGTTFCCENCCHKNKHKDEGGKVCEFC